jgi:hypothetical protein
MIPIRGIGSTRRGVHVGVQAYTSWVDAGNQAGDMAHIACDERICEQRPKADIRRALVVLLEYGAAVGAEKGASYQLNLARFE